MLMSFNELLEWATCRVYRLSMYAFLNLADDAVYLALLFA